MRKSKQQVQRIIQEFESCALTRREFCQRRGIPITTLDYWRRSQRGKPRWVEVSVAAGEPVSGFTLGLTNGRHIESSWRFDEGELARLIRIAESA